MNPAQPVPNQDLIPEGLRIKLMLSATVAVWFSALTYFVTRRPTNKTTRRILWSILVGVPAAMGALAYVSAQLGG